MSPRWLPHTPAMVAPPPVTVGDSACAKCKRDFSDLEGGNPKCKRRRAVGPICNTCDAVKREDPIGAESILESEGGQARWNSVVLYKETWTGRTCIPFNYLVKRVSNMFYIEKRP